MHNLPFSLIRFFCFTVSNNVQYQDEYNFDNGSNTWQPTGSVSIPAAPPLPPPVSSLSALPDELWHYFRDLSFDTQREMDVSDPRNKAIPPMYGNAFPLDIETKTTRSSFGYPMSTYKVVSREDGYVYCLRRVDNVKSVSHTVAAAVTDRWAAAITNRTRCPVLDHPGLVRFVRCFVAHRAVFFLHHYCPGARTLRERLAADPSFWTESLLWSAISQLVAAIRAVHGGTMACRTLQLNHILCLGIGSVRVKINALGIVDALEFESRKKVEDLQVEDMRDLGRLLMSLATGTEITKKSDSANIRRCDIFISQNYSPELHSLIFSLLQPNKPPPSIFAISNTIAAHTMDELERQQLFLERTEEALRLEFESSRALRLLIKMGFVNERPELGMNCRWNESGDCYILKLFRDYGTIKTKLN
jgi:PAB-dependent poly(A)-specific ribonuclease subunit 3